MLKLLFIVFLGSGLGGVTRWSVSELLGRIVGFHTLWPWATFGVNILGCFLIGLVYGLSTSLQISSECRLLLTTGFCGGLTTFSTFSNETLTLLQNGNIALGMLYAAASLIAGLLAAWAGHSLS